MGDRWMLFERCAVQPGHDVGVVEKFGWATQAQGASLGLQLFEHGPTLSHGFAAMAIGKVFKQMGIELEQRAAPINPVQRCIQFRAVGQSRLMTLPIGADAVGHHHADNGTEQTLIAATEQRLRHSRIGQTQDHRQTFGQFNCQQFAQVLRNVMRRRGAEQQHARFLVCVLQIKLNEWLVRLLNGHQQR
ncbi:hypothetical protein D3C84_594230 [compost metagenome]